MAHPASLADEQRGALDRLSRCPELHDFYLAGGTAIALELGHRQSLDLDFFSRRPDADLERIERAASVVFLRLEVVNRSDVALKLVCDSARNQDLLPRAGAPTR